jgi:hypothetical protein
MRALFKEMDAVSPLVQPGVACHGFEPVKQGELSAAIAAAIERSTGLRRSGQGYAGWVGIECPSVGAAISTMRLLSALNVLARREDTILYVPVNPVTDPTGKIVAQAVAELRSLTQREP